MKHTLQAKGVMAAWLPVHSLLADFQSLAVFGVFLC